eukprot:TRINITY_DN3621_c0_g1_i1.p1 TRINITY_DN3621_c0_g1~~TRINITY_DN3621_c0_g1_i1.p1  ORF type:complete len:989 (+),score=120.85 TRINITY_DN3621_c0_g1_i1:71-3037(+)
MRTKSPVPGRVQQRGFFWGRVCILVALAVVVVMIAQQPVEEEEASSPLVTFDRTSAQVSEILGSQGLLEYTGVLESVGLTSLAAIASQTENQVPPKVKPFHWRMILHEAKRVTGKGKVLQDFDTSNGGLQNHVTAPLPIVTLKDAPEDNNKLDMPKSRTIGHCHVTRSFIPTDKEDNPPLFWSFPGSGNTWIRFLIEQATGYYTGSVYRDLDIIKVMPGELRCDKSVVAVKGHPNWTPFDLVDGAYRDGARWSALQENGRDRIPDIERWYGISGIKPIPTIRGFYKKCAEVEIQRALVVTRDPYAALWAEYQRVKSERVINGTKEYGHVAKLAKADFDPEDMRGHIIGLTQDWVLQFVGYEGFIERHGCGSVLFQPFEELVNPATRDAALQRISSHLRKPLVTTPECAFTLADHPAIRRDKVKDPAYMTMKDAYDDPAIRDLVCDMYEIAGPELEVFGYKAPAMGPSKGKCPPTKRRKPVISRHAVLTSGTLNCETDRVKGMSSPGYFLHPDVHDNTTHPKEVKTREFFKDVKKPVTTDDGIQETTLGGGVDFDKPYLTIASTGRNDNHSGNVVARTQNQITNLAAYAERYKLFIEVIIVEWNPEPDRKPLSNVLFLPNTTSGKYINVRILTVSEELHKIAVTPPIHMPVQQYIGKNIAVRRARGEFVLCWNADMLLNGAFFERVRLRNFKKGLYYRIDRIDFDKPFPDGFDIGNLEAAKEAAWIELHTYQIRTAVGTRTLPTHAEKATFWHDFHYLNDTTHKFSERCCAQLCERHFKSCRWMKWAGWSGDQIRAEVPKYHQRGQLSEIEDILNIPQQFHANAPGDFLMMSRDDWMKLRGYPEAPYQDEMDKYIMAEAFAAGMDQEIMMPPVASFHQYHSGSWGSVGGLTEDMAKRPSLGQRKYIEDGRDMLIKGLPVTLWNHPNELGCNNANWGFGNIALHEMLLQPKLINTTRNGLRVIREPFDQLKHAVSPGCGWKYDPKAGNLR